MTLDNLKNTKLTVTLSDGRELPVKPMDGYGYQLSQQSKDNEQEAMVAMFKLAARALGLPLDEVTGTEDTVGISIQDAARVVAISSGQIAKVEASASPFSEAAAETATV